MDLDIPLIETGLFSSRDSFYHVVMQRNIKTVRDLLNSEEEILRRKFKTKKNFQGFCGLLRFVYLGEPFSQSLYLDSEAYTEGSFNNEDFYSYVDFYGMGFNAIDIRKLKKNIATLRTFGLLEAKTTLGEALEMILDRNYLVKKNDESLKNKIVQIIRAYKAIKQIDEKDVILFNLKTKLAVLRLKEEALQGEISALEARIFSMENNHSKNLC